ncbi:MAG: hypothetical protein KF809_08275 [Chloroflexi bacterium]|nr:hypothetical protein [Chloroflexota bacterium]
MSTTRTAPAATAPPLEVLGATWCEDTAIVRSRLHHLGVPYRYLDIDHAPGALDRVRALNDGHQVTPTVVVGDVVVAEPTLERLGEILRGWAATEPVVEAPVEPSLDGSPPVGPIRPLGELTQLHGEITQWPIPFRDHVTADGTTASLGSLRGRRQVCLFLAHDTDCGACFGYARQLSRHGTALDAADTTLVIAAISTAEELETWRHGLGTSDLLVADPDGSWRTALSVALDLDRHATSVVLLDRFLAPRVTASAPEAGGLPDPSTALEWLDFLGLECPECSGELPWPTESA